MISAEAGVSPRTFFNYFRSKDAAVLHGPGELPPDLVAAFVAVGPAEPREVLADLTRLLVAGLEANPPERGEMRDVFELAHDNPAVLAGMLVRFDAFRRSMAEAVARRTGQRADDEVPSLIAAVALVAVQGALERWAKAVAAAASPVPYVERSVALLHTLLTPEPRPLGVHDEQHNERDGTDAAARAWARIIRTTSSSRLSSAIPDIGVEPRSLRTTRAAASRL